MLAVVEDEQELARGQFRGDRIDQGAAGERPQVERLRDRVGHACAFTDRVELDEDGAVGERVLAAPGELEGEPRLARAAGAREREQARASEQRPQFGELVLAPHECARLER